MTWDNFGTTMLFVAVGYLIGSISFSVILTKIFKHDDVRSHGSGNAGATNTLRAFGFKIGLSVFLLDVSKPIIAVLIAYFVKINTHGAWNEVLLPAVSLATVVGHIWPAFFKFKGGKGSACFLGFFISMQWILAVIGFILFMSIVLKTKKVSLGSLVAPFTLIIIQIIFGATGILQESWSVPMMDNEWWINTIFLSLVWLLTLYKHKGNVKRLLNGTENSISLSKK